MDPDPQHWYVITVSGIITSVKIFSQKVFPRKGTCCPLCAQTTVTVVAYWYAVLWNCEDLLRFRFRLWKSSGFGSSPQFFNKILLFSVRSSFVSQNIGLKFFYFVTFMFYSVGSGYKPGSGTGNGMHYGSGPVPLTQKVAVPVPQNTAGTVCYVRLFVQIFYAFGGSLISL